MGAKRFHALHLTETLLSFSDLVWSELVLQAHQRFKFGIIQLGNGTACLF